MEEVRKYIVLAMNGQADVSISHDPSTNEVVGKINAYVWPSDNARLAPIEPEELRDATEEDLMNRCKYRVAELIGSESYLNWNERKGDWLDKSYYSGHSFFRVQCTKRTEGTRGELWRFRYWELYDSLSIGKDESHLVWYKDSEPAAVISKDDFFKYFRVRGRQDSSVKIHEYDVETANAAFTLEVFSNPGSTELVARFEGSTPGRLMPIGEGGRYPEMKLINEEELRGSDKEDLLKRCKERLTELGGQITHFIDRTATGRRVL